MPEKQRRRVRAAARLDQPQPGEAILTGAPNRSRHTWARLRPVATPSLVLTDWIGTTIGFAVTTTRSSR